MIYPDGSPMDANLRLIECPRCHNAEFSDGAYHCRICGLTLYNHCVGDEYAPVHNNPGNARYCETCGAKTRFFLEGILKPYAEADPVEVHLEDEGSDDAPFTPKFVEKMDGDRLPF